MMMSARDHPLTQQLLTLWKLTAIEPVPPDFEETVLNILKHYPPPANQNNNKE
jgi:hypothetical protein